MHDIPIKENGCVNYVDGKNIASFIKIADAIIAQGIFKYMTNATMPKPT
ncbi:hypothetical protein JKI98_10885 [Acinetobacter nectaris]|nr:hypothetical protein [Acinetobacter nectaris]